jgi:hypothetical protein
MATNTEAEEEGGADTQVDGAGSAVSRCELE